MSELTKTLRELSEEKLSEEETREGICGKEIFLNEAGDVRGYASFVCWLPKGHEGPHRTYYDWSDEEGGGA
jgi:hypothetical protein